MTSPKPATEIQRYGLTDRMFPWSEGDWVSYTDHLAALAQHTVEQRERVASGLQELRERGLLCYLGQPADGFKEALEIILKHLGG